MSGAATVVPIGERCVLCSCRLETPLAIERGLCGSCVKRPEAGRLARDDRGRAQPRSRPQAIVVAAAPRATFTPAERSLIKSIGGYMPTAELLRILNERRLADLGPAAAPYTLEHLHAGIQDLIDPSPAADWAGLRRILAGARRAGVLAAITSQTIDDFAIVFSLNTQQVMHLRDVVRNAQEAK